jgi:flagellar FliJ protein
MKFKFPLQRLLDLKEKREQELARQLAAARRDAAAEAGQRDTLNTLRAEGAAHVAAQSTGIASVGEIAALSFAVAQLAAQVELADQRTEAAEQVVHDRSDALNGAVQDRRVLDRLRDRRQEQHRASDQQDERAKMDAVALSRFSARRASTNDSSQEPT